jgi:hypothetical protein
MTDRKRDTSVTPETSRRRFLEQVGLGGLVGLDARGDGGRTDAFEGLGDGVHLSEASERDTYWSGPEEDRPADAPAGTRYFATDTGRQFAATSGGWRKQGFAGPFVAAEEIRGVADYVVTTAAELEAAMDSLADGETVFLANGTYRTTRWLSIDRSDVTVVGQSGRGTIVSPADGANVGGFHVGRDRHVENVLIRGVGFHGNADNMDQSVRRLHAFLVDDARHVTIRDCFATRTSPYHVHDAGGSGFTVRRDAQAVSLVGNETTDVGDRGVQVAGSDVLVRGNRLTDGFDRAVSLEVRHPDGRKYLSRNVSVVNNLGRDNARGSVVGASQGSPARSGAGNYTIVGNVAAGAHRRAVFFGVTEDVGNVAIVGNVGRQAAFDERRSGIHVKGTLSDVSVVGNSLSGYTLDGVQVDGDNSTVTVAGNSVRATGRDGIRIDAVGAAVAGNTVHDAGAVGVRIRGGEASVTNNAVRGTGAHGVVVRGDAPSLLSANAVREVGTDEDASAIRVDGSGWLVATNLVAADRSVGVADTDAASDNVYVGNRVHSEDAAWAVTGAGSRFAGNVPERPEVRLSYRVVAEETFVTFDRAYPEMPDLDVVPETPAFWGVEWERDEDGSYVGAHLRLESPGDDTPAAHVTVRRP